MKSLIPDKWQRRQGCPTETWDWGHHLDTKRMTIRLTRAGTGRRGGWMVTWWCPPLMMRASITLPEMTTEEAKANAFLGASRAVGKDLSEVMRKLGNLFGEIRQPHKPARKGKTS